MGGGIGVLPVVWDWYIVFVVGVCSLVFLYCLCLLRLGVWDVVWDWYIVFVVIRSLCLLYGIGILFLFVGIVGLCLLVKVCALSWFVGMRSSLLRLGFCFC